MYRVTADGLENYLAFDLARKSDLLRIHDLIRKSAPGLKRYFHKGTPAGEAGMRMKIIGYGKSRYAVKSRKTIEWPVIGVSLQKNYISVYVAVRRNGCLSFERYDDLKIDAVSSLFAEIARILENEPQNPVEYMQGA